MKKLKLLLLFFVLILITPNVYAKELKTGTYRIHYANDEEKILVEKDGNIELGDSNSQGITTWNIYSDGAYFYIRSSEDNSIALSSENDAQNGINIKKSDTNELKYQKWEFVQTDSMYYYIKSSQGDYNIDVLNCGKELGTNIQLWSSNGSIAQKWKLERINDNNPTLEDGTYVVKAYNNTNNVIDLYGGRATNSTNIQTYGNNYTWAQLWNIKYNDGYYTISSYIDNNKVIDVSGAIFKKYTNIQLYQTNGTNAQKWILEKNDDNTYSFSSYDGLWKIDIDAGSSNPGANIQLYQTNGTNAQKFSFEKATVDYLEDGYYKISSLLGKNMVVGINNSAATNGKNVTLTKDNVFRHTKWYIKRVDRDIYIIANAQNKEKVLDVQEGKIVNGSNVQLYQTNGTNAQKWIIRKNSDDTYRIIGIGSGKSLDIASAGSTEGTNVNIYTSNNTNAQKFNIIPVDQSAPEQIENVKYVIKSNAYQNKVIDVSGAYKDNNTNVQLWDLNNTKAQVWKPEHLGEGKYILKSMINPSLVLTASSSNVISKKYNGSDSQKWLLYRDGNDKLTIYNIGQGKYLYIEGNAKGSNISLSETQSDKNEIIFEQFTKPLVYRGIDVSAHNGDIKWENFRNQIDFAVIRAGYSGEVINENGVDIYQDKKFLRNVEECEKYNIPYGLYLYSYAKSVYGPDNSAIDEANHMLSLISKAKKNNNGPNLSVPIYYDLEDDMTYNATNYDATALTNINDKFCSIIETNGYQCGLYSFLYGFGYMGKENVKNLASKYGIWVAHVKWYDYYPDEDQFNVISCTDNRYNKSDFNSKYSIQEKIWQYSHQGNIPSANTGQGHVDLNIGYDIFE